MSESRGIYLFRLAARRHEASMRAQNRYDSDNCKIESDMIAAEQGLSGRTVRAIRREVRTLFDAVQEAYNKRHKRHA
jgi:hypothetical protein